MAEVFQGTPVLVSVRIDGPDGRMIQYHVAGRDVSFVSDAVKQALSDLPDQEAEANTKKERKPRAPNKPKNLPAPGVEKSAGEQAMDRLKKDAATTETVWP